MQQVRGARVGPEQQAQLEGALAEVLGQDAWLGLGEDPLDGGRRGREALPGLERVLGVGHADDHLEPPPAGRARVDEHVREEQLVRDDDLLAVQGAEHRRTHADVLDLALRVGSNDQVTFREWMLEQQHDPGHEVAQYVLEREARGDGREPEAADEHAEVDTADRERDHQAQDDDPEVGELGDEQVHVRLGRGAAQAGLDPPPHDPGDRDREDQEDDGGEQVRQAPDEAFGEPPERLQEPVDRERRAGLEKVR